MSISIKRIISNLEGITTALMTPLRSEGSLDVEGYRRLIDKLIDEGIVCLFPLGWAGEGPLLTDALRVQVMRECCTHTAGRRPVMIGVSEQSLSRVQALVRIAEEAGADLLLATPPYSYDITPALVYDFFVALSKMTELPIVIYENGEISVQAGIENLKRLAERTNIVGVKATVSASLLPHYFAELHDPERFAVISGDEMLFGYALFLGMKHFTMGGPGNFCTRWCVETYRAGVEGKLGEVSRRQTEFVNFLERVYATSESPYAVSKYLLKRQAVCNDWINSPHRRLTSDEAKKADSVVEQFPAIFAESSPRSQ
jgi:4-hydroxy-tetrahydrodipicolinate synthase